MNVHQQRNIQRRCGTYIYNGVLLGHEKNEMPFVGTWMDLDIIILSEVNQTEKDKYHMILLTCQIFLK